MWKLNWSIWHVLESSYWKFTIFVHLSTHDNFDSADPSSMQDACHIRTQLNDFALHEFL